MAFCANSYAAFRTAPWGS